MKQILFGFLLLAVSLCALAETPDAQFVRIYKLIQDGDTALASNQNRVAAEKYLNAQTELRKLQSANPAWNERVVKYRFNYLSEKLSSLNTLAPAGKETAVATAPAKVDKLPAIQWPEVRSVEAELKTLNLQVRQLNNENALLQSKLKEALTAQPAAADPRELTKAEDRIRRLQKENDLLKVSLQREQVKPGQGVDPAVLEKSKKALAEAIGKLEQQTEAIDRLQLERKALQGRLETSMATASAKSTVLEPSSNQTSMARGKSGKQTKETNDAALRKVQNDLTQAHYNIKKQTEKLEALIVEKQALQQQLQSTGSNSQFTAVKSENDALKKQLADFKNASQSSAKADEIGQRLRLARVELAEQRFANETLRSEKLALKKRLKRFDAQQSANEALRTENRAFEKQLDQLMAQRDAQKSEKSVAPEAFLSASQNAKTERVEAQKIKRLEKERDELQKKLEVSKQELAKNQMQTKTMKVNQFTKKIEELTARLAALESRKVPYTAEELALFQAPAHAPSPPVLVASNAKPTAVFQLTSQNKTPPTQPAAPEKRVEAAPSPASESKPAKKTLRDLPSGAGPLVAEAQRAFAARRFAEAEQKYLQVLKLDEKNVFTLANLATIQLEQNRLSDAEATLNKALAEAAQDPFSLSLLGILKFRQEKYDEALTTLSQSARLDPQNAETQNYLGITLSQKGQREPAEAALRKAIQLTPSYAGAHYNLAVVYATQQPPFRELARLHYRKAINGGHPANVELEKLLNATAPAGGSQ